MVIRQRHLAYAATNHKCVYLTFDDGPIPGVTPWVLEILRTQGVKATFFMVGENVLRNPDLLEQVKRGGHAVGNHSLSHIQGMKTDRITFLDNVERGSEITGKLVVPTSSRTDEAGADTWCEKAQPACDV